MESSDADLVSRATAGDDEALAQLLRRYGGNVRARVHAALSEKWRCIIDADDVMQVTYLEAFLQIARFVSHGEGAFAGWLTRIAMNNLRDAVESLERQKRPQPDQRVVSAGQDHSAVSLLGLLGGSMTTASQHATRHEINQAVNAALGELPDDYATVVRMYDLEGSPAEVVGATLGRTTGAVYMLRARAHDRLREVFAGGSWLSTVSPPK